MANQFFLIRSEWTTQETRYSVEINDDLLTAVYPDMKASERTKLLSELQSGKASVTDFYQAVQETGIEMNPLDDFNSGDIDRTLAYVQSKEQLDGREYIGELHEE